MPQGRFAGESNETMNVKDNLKKIQSTIPSGVVLVAVSKFHPVQALKEAYDAGQRVFGESRVQELSTKIPAMPTDVQWHFIGHLQTNKVRQLLSSGNIAMIESVDSERLLNLIDKESERLGIITKVLLQIHVAAEETKSGFSPDELDDFFRRGAFRSLKATHICGIMGMASNTDDQARIAKDFAAIASARLRALNLAPDLVNFNILSMGMSHDYPLAIEAGATHVRVGTAIFGNRY